MSWSTDSKYMVTRDFFIFSFINILIPARKIYDLIVFCHMILKRMVAKQLFASKENFWFKYI